MNKKILTKTILSRTDSELRITDLASLVEDILSLYAPKLHKIDLDKYHIFTNTVFPEGHWEHDDAGRAIWVE